MPVRFYLLPITVENNRSVELTFSAVLSALNRPGLRRSDQLPRRTQAEG